MTENDNHQPAENIGTKSTTPDSPQAGKSAGGKVALLVALLALLLAAAASGAAAWIWLKGAPGQQANQALLKDLNSRLEGSIAADLKKLAAQQSTSVKQGDALGERLTAVEAATRRQEASAAELADLVQGGRLAWRLAEVEHLLGLANDRILLARDVPGAIAALEAADERLGRLSEPRLMGVRRQIVEDIAALRAVPEPDRAGIALRLSSLIERVPSLPLRHRVPGSFESPEEAIQAASTGAEDRWQRALATLREAWRGLVHIRHTEQRIEPLLPPDQEFFLRQNLILKLEAAYLALMQGDSTKYQQSMKRAIVWLADFYDRDEAVVSSAIEQLSEVAKAELAMPLPDLSGSLELLRRYQAGPGGVSQRTETQTGEAN